MEWMGSCVRDGGGMRKVQKFSSLVLASLKPLNVRKPYASGYHSLRPCQASFFTILYRVADYSWRGGGHGRSGGKSCFSGAGLHTLSGRLDPGSLWCMPYDRSDRAATAAGKTLSGDGREDGASGATVLSKEEQAMLLQFLTRRYCPGAADSLPSIEDKGDSRGIERRQGGATEGTVP